MNLNWKLKASIYAQGWNQKAFAEAIGVSELELSRLITGRKIPTANIRREIADMLMTPEVDLFDAANTGSDLMRESHGKRRLTTPVE